MAPMTCDHIGIFQFLDKGFVHKLHEAFQVVAVKNELLDTIKLWLQPREWKMCQHKMEPNFSNGAKVWKRYRCLHFGLNVASFRDDRLTARTLQEVTAHYLTFLFFSRVGSVVDLDYKSQKLGLG